MTALEALSTLEEEVAAFCRRLSHLLDAARKAMAYAANRTREDLDDDEWLRLVC